LRRVVRDFKEGCAVTEVDAHARLLRRRLAERFEQRDGRIAASAGVDDEISGKRLTACVMFELDAADSAAIRCGGNFAHPAAPAQRDVCASFDARAQRLLDQRAGHAVRTPAEVALWERVEAGPLVTYVVADPLQNRPRCAELAGEAGKEVVEGLESSAEQPMRVPVLRRTAAVLWSRRERITFENRHAFEVIAQRTRTRQTRDPGADYDRVVPEHRVPGVHRASAVNSGDPWSPDASNRDSRLVSRTLLNARAVMVPSFLADQAP
jgi:hypothetical protein